MVRVSSPQEVLRATEQLLVSAWPHMRLAPVERAFGDFDALFAGRMPGYAGVDTVYHDRQHTLDVTLAMARLLVGHERQVDAASQLGAERAVVGVVLALFHDVGYLRRSSDREQANGAEFTRSHVSRGAEFLRHYLPQIGLASWIDVASQIIHFTGYERPFAQIVTHRRARYASGSSARHGRHDRAAGRSLLSGKVPRPALSGVRARRCRALDRWRRSRGALRLGSGSVASDSRLRRQYAQRRAWTAISIAPIAIFEVLFEGRNPYIESIDRNMQYLEQVLRSESWRMLRRNPPLHAADPETLGRVRSLMLGYFKKAWLQD